MADFECTCSVTKGERTLAWGEDCYAYYPKPNYGEHIVRCRDCKHWGDAKYPTCCDNGPWGSRSDGFCAWGEPKEG